MEIDRIVGNVDGGKCSIPLRQNKKNPPFLMGYRGTAMQLQPPLGMRWHGRRFQIEGNAALGCQSCRVLRSPWNYEVHDHLHQLFAVSYFSCFLSLFGTHSLWGGSTTKQNPILRSFYSCGSPGLRLKNFPPNWKASDLQDDQRKSSVGQLVPHFGVARAIYGIFRPHAICYPSISNSYGLGRRSEMDCGI